MDPEEREIYDAEVKRIMVDQLQLKSAEERGELRGERRGELRGLQRAVLTMMTHRIGEVPGNVATQLRGLSAKELEDLTSVAFDFTSYADVERWLTRH
jgi:hypothetical protein